MTKTEVGYHAIRNSVAFAEEPELRCLQLTGSRAFDALDTVCPCDIFLQDGQMKHTLLLDDTAIPFADVYVCREGENAYLIGYGSGADEIANWITHHATDITDFSIVDLGESHDNLAIDGPYAWELGAEVFGPDILGLPYLGMLVLDAIFVFRAGRTGEYGYNLLVPTDQKDRWVESLLATGAGFEMARADAVGPSPMCIRKFLSWISIEKGSIISRLWNCSCSGGCPHRKSRTPVLKQYTRSDTLDGRVGSPVLLRLTL